EGNRRRRAPLHRRFAHQRTAGVLAEACGFGFAPGSVIGFRIARALGRIFVLGAGFATDLGADFAADLRAFAADLTAGLTACFFLPAPARAALDLEAGFVAADSGLCGFGCA